MVSINECSAVQQDLIDDYHIHIIMRKKIKILDNIKLTKHLKDKNEWTFISIDIKESIFSICIQPI